MSLKTRVVAWLALLAAGMLSLVWAYIYGGGADLGLLDRAGPVVTWGLPAAKLVFNLACAGTIGALMLAVFALPSGELPHRRALRVAGCSAAVWAGAAAAHTYASFLLLANRAPTAGLDEAFLTYLTNIDAGRAGALSTLIAAAVAALCFRPQGPRTLAVTVVVAFAGLLPLVMRSHAAGGTDHADSTTALFVHAAAAAVWLGGLLVLVMLWRILPAGQLGVTVRRYSTLALISFIALAVSGFLGALTRISTVDALLTPYGVIILAKAGVFIVLGLFGVLHRRWSVGRIAKDPGRGGRHFVALAVAELAVMGVASGMAAALARTEPPPAAGSGKTSAGDFAAGLPEPGLWEYLSRWAPDPLWSLACGFAAFAYLAGVRRLRAQGQLWPASRTVAWLAGIAVLFVVTNGGVHVYQGYLFNAHVLTQMTLTAVVPLLLVPAAPLTLADLAVSARTDGSSGVKEFLAKSAQPVLAALRRDPVLAISLLAVSLFLIYYTPLLEWAAVGQIGYNIMTLLALSSGCLALAALTGAVDPGTSSPSKRLFVLAGMAGVYAFAGWKLAEQAPALEMPWYTAVGQPWGPSPAAAPETGGIIMWSIAAIALAITTAMIMNRRGPSSGQPSHEHADRTADSVPLG
jgi:cytochrome c oxidase assembly factor CtaG/putative copper export protein